MSAFTTNAGWTVLAAMRGEATCRVVTGDDQAVVWLAKEFLVPPGHLL